MGPFKCYVTQMGVGGVRFSGKKHYEGVRFKFNVICVTRGCPISRKKRYVTLEWPLWLQKDFAAVSYWSLFRKNCTT